MSATLFRPLSWGFLCGFALLLSSSAARVSRDQIARVYGKIQIVEHFPDYKVKVVQSFPDLKVKKVTAFPDGPGKWQIVTHHPDFKIQLVDAFPDFTIQFVDHFPGLAQ